MKEGDEIKKCMFYLRDKHLYSTNTLNSILTKAEVNMTNSVTDFKCVLDMIRWYISVRASILKIMPKIFDAQRQ